MKIIRTPLLLSTVTLLAACASGPTSSPVLQSYAKNDSTGKGAVIFCKHHRKLSNAGKKEIDSIDAINILFGSGRGVMNNFSMYFMKHDNDKLTTLFYSPSTNYDCGLVNLKLGSYKIVSASANVPNFAAMTGKPVSTEVVVSKGTPKIILAGYTAIPPFSMTWGFKDVSPSQTAFDECNALRKQNLTFKEKITNFQEKFKQTSDLLACEAILKTKEVFDVPAVAQKWVSKRESKILKAL